jgi:hypothetical protein
VAAAARALRSSPSDSGDERASETAPGGLGGEWPREGGPVERGAAAAACELCTLPLGLGNLLVCA